MAQATPTAAQAFTVGVLLQAQDRLVDAEQAYAKAVALDPGHFDALLALGTLYLMRGAAADAMPLLARAVTVTPDSADAHHRLGMALAKLGRPMDAVAEYGKAIALAPGKPAMQNDLGAALAGLGRTVEAIAHFERAVALAPDDADAHANLANALSAIGRGEESLPHFARALTLQPKSVAAEYGLGAALATLERHREAVGHFTRAIALEPGLARAYIGLGGSLNALGRPHEAAAAFERALALEPENPEAYAGLGTARQFLGDLDAARRDFERAVEIAPDKPSFHHILAEAKRFRDGDAQLATMEALANNAASLSEEQRIALAFALGKANDDLGRHEAAFGHFWEGNTLKRKEVKYDEKATLDLWSYIAQVFTPQMMQRQAGGGDPSGVPVFILGMPRSGSTLVEQILASHPNVFGAGELTYLADAARTFRGRDVTAYFPAVAARLSPDALRMFGADYVAKLRAHAPDAERITDKMPANFRFIGLIRLALPNARIIHTVRDPLDTCWSCYTKLFRGAQQFSYDLGELGRYYRAYRALMTHWRAVLPPGAMLEVQYEELVGDFENHARRIVEFCGMAWDERCLAFYQTRRPVRTASVTQVRKPIFATSIGRWRAYEAWLAPLRDELGSKH